MFRTRDFILLFSAILFLVMAIGTTLINQGWSSASDTTFAIDSENDSEYLATVVDSDNVSRAERIAQMRSKISQQALITETVEQNVEPEENVDEEQATSTEEIAVAGVIECPLYRPYTTFWDARDLAMIESEGARVFARGEISSTSIPEVVLQLLVRNVPSGNPSCLSSNVIGIANDGSLIRNDEVGLYGIFSADTLIGYALDGFPIYGTGTAAADACGGVASVGGYRYELSPDRDTVINCFAATPALLP